MPIRFVEIWLMLLLMLICYERKTLFLRWKVLLKNRAESDIKITLELVHLFDEATGLKTK
jgi:hypothetical protein